MSGWQTAGMVALPVLAGWSVVRILARVGTRNGDYAAAAFWSALAIGLGLGGGPGWLLAAGCVTAVAALLAHLLVLAVRAANRPQATVDPAAFRARLLEVCTADGSPPALMTGVGPDGTITVWGLEEAGVPRDRHHPSGACPTCLLEEFVTELAVNGEQTVRQYRAQLRRRANQLFVLHRGVISGDWEAELSPVRGPKAPYRHAACPVHRY
ncbi:hypothetical protein ACWEPB_24870 [Kitasatospora cineracea]